MAIYEYRCGDDGPFEILLAIGTAPSAVPCPVCARVAPRVWSAPMTALVAPGLAAALDHEEKTRHDPDVVTSIPSRPARQRTPVLPLTPTLSRLPRP